MIDIVKYNSYFKNIAEQHKGITGFLKLSTKDLGEAQTAIRDSNFPAESNILVLENFEIKQKAANHDQVADIATGLFSVFQVFNPRGKYDLEVIAAETLQICRQIEARMRRDQCDYSNYDLLSGSFEFEPCHAPLLNMFGWRVFFDFATHNNTEYDYNIWNE